MLQTVFTALCEGFGKSLEIFALTLVGALPLGLLVALGSMSRFKPLSMIFGWNPWSGSPSGRFMAAIVAFVFNYACYFSEIYRGGIEAIPKGQTEAGQVLGMTRPQIFFRVTLLQVVKRILAPISNEVITLVKDTSLARVILVYELMWRGQDFIKSEGIIWPLFATGLFYLAFTGILTLLFGRMEKRLDYFRV